MKEGGADSVLLYIVKIERIVSDRPSTQLKHNKTQICKANTTSKYWSYKRTIATKK